MVDQSAIVEKSMVIVKCGSFVFFLMKEVIVNECEKRERAQPTCFIVLSTYL